MLHYVNAIEIYSTCGYVLDVKHLKKIGRRCRVISMAAEKLFLFYEMTSGQS